MIIEHLNNDDNFYHSYTCIYPVKIDNYNLNNEPYTHYNKNVNKPSSVLESVLVFHPWSSWCKFSRSDDTGSFMIAFSETEQRKNKGKSKWKIKDKMVWYKNTK